MISGDADKIRRWLDAVIPDNTEGWLHVALGVDGYFNDNDRYTFDPENWRPKSFHWPDERGEAFDWILDMAQQGDVYGCPNLLTGRRRTLHSPPRSASSYTATSTTASTATR